MSSALSPFVSILLSVLFMLVFSGLQFLGVIGFGKTRRDAAWCCMMIGSVIYAITSLASVLQSSAYLPLRLPQLPMEAFMIIALVRTVALLLFIIGFAMKGWQGLRLQKRVEELELLSLAQATELERLRNR